MKTYTVIPHSCPSGLALRQQPEMKEPYKSSFQKGYSDDFLDLDKMLDKEKYNQAVRAYDKHIASLEIIDIAIEHKEHWKEGGSVNEDEFIRSRKFTGYTYPSLVDGSEITPAIVAIPKGKEGEQESGWISVKDRSPEEKQEVTVYFKNEAGWHVTGCYWDGNNFIWLCEECGLREQVSYKTPITHWRPLPEPPHHKEK